MLYTEIAGEGMKLGRSQVVLLCVLVLSTAGVIGALAVVAGRNLPQIRLVLAAMSSPTVAPATESVVIATASPSATPAPTATATPHPAPTVIPVLPQTRFDLQIGRDPANAALRLQRGKVYLDLGVPDLALADYEAAIQIDPTLADAFLGRGQALFALKQWQRALADFEQATLLDPLLPDALTWRGTVLLERGEHALALEAFQRAAALGKIGPRLHTLTGEALRRSGHAEDALAEYELALVSDERYLAAFVGRAMAEAELGEVDRAYDDLAHALDLVPHDPLALNGLAWLYAWYRGDHLADAESLAKRALAGASDDLARARCLHTLGWTYYRLERYQEAAIALEKAASLMMVDGEVVLADLAAHLEIVRAAAAQP
jgi:tetratricopeptide (TPR) repeat protein